MKISGAEMICKVLIEQGVDTVFGYPGGSVLPIYDELYRYQDKIKHYLTAHEQGASHAADGYARVSGKTGVVIATSGPGTTNLVTGIATAYMDSVPMVAITGNVGSDLIGKDSFQEVYTLGITMPITKHNFFVQDTAELPQVLRKAFEIAGSGRKGPVLIDITKDATIQKAEFLELESEVKSKAPDSREQDLEKLISLLLESKRPLICFGGGVMSSAATDEIHALVHKAEIPAVHTIMGTGALSHFDSLNLGMVGMHGSVTSNLAVHHADFLLAIGFRFSDRVALNTEMFAKNAKIVQIDIDPSEVNKNVKVDHAVIGDIKAVLQALLSKLSDMKHTEWMEEISAWKQDDYRPVDDDEILRPHQIIGTIASMAGEEAVLVTDVGQHQMWAAQYCERTKPRSFITSGGLGTMGFGYGAAIGAKIFVGEERPVVHITGDGSFHMNLNEASTAVSYELPIISVIFNNNVLGMVHQWQSTFYEERFSSSVMQRKTDFVKVAEGFGAKGFRCKNLAEFCEAMAQALSSKEPVWIECIIDPDEKVLPMIPSGKTVEDIIVE